MDLLFAANETNITDLLEPVAEALPALIILGLVLLLLSMFAVRGRR